MWSLWIKKVSLESSFFIQVTRCHIQLSVGRSNGIGRSWRCSIFWSLDLEKLESNFVVLFVLCRTSPNNQVGCDYWKCHWAQQSNTKQQCRWGYWFSRIVLSKGSFYLRAVVVADLICSVFWRWGVSAMVRKCNKMRQIIAMFIKWNFVNFVEEYATHENSYLYFRKQFVLAKFSFTVK